LQEQVREDRQLVDADVTAEQDRRQKMQKVFKKQRDAVSQMKKARDLGTIAPHEVEAIMKPKAVARSLAAAGAVAVAPPAKPLWAMTEAQKDDFEEQETADLIRFAEDCDFDRYISDLEFRQNLQVIKDRAKKLQKEQDAFKESILQEFNAQAGDDDLAAEANEDVLSAANEDVAGSENGRARRYVGGGGGLGSRPDWDGSTAGGDEGREENREARSAAERLLEANPRLKAVHSKGSVQKLVEKVQDASE